MASSSVSLSNIILFCLVFHWHTIHTEATSFFSLPSPWTWVCQNSTCQKLERVPNENQGMSLAACKLTCNEYSALWPRPTGFISLQKNLIHFQPNNLQLLKISAPAKAQVLLTEAGKLFTDQVQKMAQSKSDLSCPDTGHPFIPDGSKSHRVEVQIAVVSDEVILSLSTDESYTIHMNTVGSLTSAVITASTFFGARHGLETLSQLMAWDDTINTMLLISAATIDDKPVYPHRGFLIDTSRNYLPISEIRNIIDAMSYNKLNVFHWHLTDTHSFPFISRREPLLALYGAYSPNQVYRPEEIQDLVLYATVRGVKLLPEFDAPAHVGNGWQWGEKYGLGQLALCINEEPWRDYCVEPPCGQLNPANENIYKIIGNMYKDMAEIFPTDMFHMGGDEVKMDCWNKTEEIKKWLTDHGHTNNKEGFLHLWSYFQNTSLAKLDEAFGRPLPAILWTSGLTEDGHAEKFLDPNRYIIQIWTTGDDLHIAELYKQGFRLIISNYDALYFDCGYGAWVVGGDNNWCSPYKGWQKVYDNHLRNMISNFNVTYNASQILGSEACLWSEQVDSATVQGKLWPRGAALAERLWTDPNNKWTEAEFRMIHHRQRLVDRGIRADALQPQWCHQNEGMCF